MRAIHAWVTAVKFTSFSAISNSWRTGHALKCSSTHTDTIFIFFLYFLSERNSVASKKKKKKKKAYLMIGYLFSRFRHVMSTLASRPMTPVVGRLPSSFTSLSRKEKPSLPGPLTRLGQHTAARRRAPLPLSFLLGVYKITYDGLRESVQKISFFLNEEKFKKLPKFWAFIFLVAFVLFFSIYSFSRMTTSFFFFVFYRLRRWEISKSNIRLSDVGTCLTITTVMGHRSGERERLILAKAFVNQGMCIFLKLERCRV